MAHMEVFEKHVSLYRGHSDEDGKSRNCILGCEIFGLHKLRAPFFDGHSQNKDQNTLRR